MPTVNIYILNQEQANQLSGFIPNLKNYLANSLTCDDIKLTPAEITTRFIHIAGGKMIGNIELEITAHAFSERIKKQDEICRQIMNFIQKEVPSIGNVKVWLKLCELGHSW